jgi:hypothetical protein
VCGDHLTLTRLGCLSCGTELSGSFETCVYCALSAEDRELLGVFLASRGNMKDLERHLGVSYPTARARFDALLGRLGLQPVTAGAAEDAAGADHRCGGASPSSGAAEEARLAVLQRLARGDLDVDQAEVALNATPGSRPRPGRDADRGGGEH